MCSSSPVAGKQFAVIEWHRSACVSGGDNMASLQLYSQQTWMTTCSNGPSLWKPSTKASQLFTQRNIEAAEEKEAEGKRGREREREGGRMEKQIEEVEQGGGGGRGKTGRQIIRSSQRQSEKTGRKGQKKRRGDSIKRKKNNGERGNEATVVRDWHMRRRGSEEEEEMGGVPTKAVWTAQRTTLTTTAARPCLVHSATPCPCVQTRKWPSAPWARTNLPLTHIHIADIQVHKAMSVLRPLLDKINGAHRHGSVHRRAQQCRSPWRADTAPTAAGVWWNI